MKSIYRRVLIKISGEALAAEKKTGYDFDFVMKVCNAVKDCAARARIVWACSPLR